MAISSQGVTLKWGESEASVTTTVPVKDFPDLGGEPDNINVTTLEDTMQAFILGIQSGGSMPFKANYTQADFTTVNTDAGADMFYELSFGAEGTFAWAGQHAVVVNGAGVNGAVEMTITVAPSTRPTLKA